MTKNELNQKTKAELILIGKAQTPAINLKMSQLKADMISQLLEKPKTETKKVTGRLNGEY